MSENIKDMKSDGEPGRLLPMRELYDRLHKPKVTEVALLVDCSGSMSGARFEQMKLGCMESVAALLGDGRIAAIVSFSDSTEVVSSGIRSAAECSEAISRLRIQGGTSMAKAIKDAANLVKDAPVRLIVLITDGQPNDRKDTLAAAEIAKKDGCTIRCIGVDGADHAFLAKLAGGDAIPSTTMSNSDSLAGAIRSVTLAKMPGTAG